MKKYFKYFLASVLILFSFTLAGCASCSRELKTLDSDFSGGLDRTVILYDYNGMEINRWSGKIDLQDTEYEILFDLNGERTIIHGGIVVVQED